MGQAAVSHSKIEHPQLELIEGGKRIEADSVSALSNSECTRQALLFWAWSLVILQTLDGFMTVIGVGQFGHEAEANLLLRAGMDLFGPLTTILVAKSFAIVVIYMLVRCSRHVTWVPRALQAITALYLCAAVIPWSVILFQHYFT